MVSEELLVQALAEKSPPLPPSPEAPALPVEAHQGKEGAEEKAGIRVALPGQQGQPAD